MTTLSIVPTNPALVELIGAMNAIGSGAGFRYTERALSAVTNSIAKAWQSEVGSDRRIQKKKLTPFSHEVYSEDKMVHWLEKGLKPFDMRFTHPYGKKSRVVKPRMVNGKMQTQWTAKRKNGQEYTVRAGDPYLIIPFRHRTKGGKGKGKSLEDVYPEVRQQMGEEGFRRSYVTKAPENSGVQSPNAKKWNEMVKRAEYSWGSRIEVPEQEGYENLQGMVVMGPPKQSQFMTFRVVSVNSPDGSWMHPGIKARHYLENILKRGEDKISMVIENALAKDLGYDPGV
jgi:hypothetical protein